MSEVVTTTPTPEAAPPPPSLEDRQWAALREELEPKQEPAAEPEVEAVEPARTAEAEPERAETPEQLKTNYSNLQKALQEERNLRRAEQERWKGVQDLVQSLRASKQQDQPAPEKKVPSKDEDPIGYFEHRMAEQQAVIEQLKNGTQQFAQQTVQQQEFQQFMSVVDRSEKEIRDSKSASYKADYDDACMHLEQGRIRELMRMYPDNSPYAVQAARQVGLQTAEQLRLWQLNQDRFAVAQQALQLGQSPAEFYYNLAQDRGYQPKASNVVALKPQDKLEMTRKGVKSSKMSISGGGGSKSTDDLNLSDLADLATEDPDAFDAAWEKMAKSGKLG